MQTTQDHAVATPKLGRYSIDPSGSTVKFRTRHMFGLGPVHGSFEIRNGTVNIAEPMTASGVHAEIDSASFRTGNEQRDATVRSPRLLDADAHPVISFTAAGRFDGRELTGTLTVRGVARPITLTVEQVDAAGDGFTARATVRIDRTDFGVTAMRGLAGRYLTMTVEARCARS
jgi:polyisoprenoid-binding protein YceI